jgi:hypothetical protein
VGDTPKLNPLEIIEFVTEKREKVRQSPYKKNILKSEKPLLLSPLLAFWDSSTVLLLLFCSVFVCDFKD